METARLGLKNRIKECVFFILTIFFILCSYFHSAFPQQNLRYYLEIDEQKWNSFTVNITINHNRLEQLLCQIPDIFSWTSTTGDSTTDISDFSVLGNYGQKLNFDRVGFKAWLIDAKNNDFLIISYRVNNQSDRILGERIDRSFARVDCGAIFAYIREFKNSPIHLVVRVPDGWKLATGLTEVDQPFEYQVENYHQLIDNPLYLGRFKDIFFNIGGREGFLIIDGRKYTETGKLGNHISKVVLNQIQLFNEIPFDRYLFIVKFFPTPHQFISKAYANTSIIYSDYEFAKQNLLAIVREAVSNFFQAWNGYHFYPLSLESEGLTQVLNIPCLWFRYGVSDYYGCLSMVRAGVWTEAEFFSDYINLINKFIKKKDSQLSSIASLCSQIHQGNYQNSMELIRLKGQLLGMALDLKIREITNNSRSLDDLVVFMNRWFGTKRIGYNDEDLLLAIRAVTGADLTSFFDRYIHGAMELPLVDILKNAGVFLEVKKDTVPDLGAVTISDDGNIVTQLDKNGPLSIAGLKIGDRILSVDDQNVYYSRQLEPIIDSLKTGQEVHISVQRDRLPLMLIARVAGIPCDVVSIVSLIPQTDQQQLIRKSWLSK